MPQLSLFKDTFIIYPLKETNKGIELFIKVTPKAAKNRLSEVAEDSHKKHVLKVYVTAPPENNQANQAVIELISKQFKLAKSQISIISGGNAREKTLLIERETIESIKTKIDEL